MTVSALGIIFASDDAVAPDVVWVSKDRFDRVVGADRRLHAAPDLVVEVLSPGEANEQRDRDLERKLYSRYGVRESSIDDWCEPAIQVYRRGEVVLRLFATLTAENPLASPLLPGFVHRVAELCALPG